MWRLPWYITDHKPHTTEYNKHSLIDVSLLISSNNQRTLEHCYCQDVSRYWVLCFSVCLSSLTRCCNQTINMWIFNSNVVCIVSILEVFNKLLWLWCDLTFINNSRPLVLVMSVGLCCGVLLTWLLCCSRSANYSTEEQAKIAKKEKEEKDKKRKSSVFSRLGSSYRTKKVSTL